MLYIFTLPFAKLFTDSEFTGGVRTAAVLSVSILIIINGHNFVDVVANNKNRRRH